jgi:O-antigen/teichoic acid export membrane protein
MAARWVQHGILARALPWATKGGLAILDQGLFAGTNFLANVLLARWLSPVEYGAFALAYSVFLFCGTFYSALVTEPMMVFGAGKYQDCFDRYLGLVLRTQCIIGAGLTLLLLCGALVAELWVHSPGVGWAVAGAAVATPCILSLWVVRGAFYVRLQPAWAAAGGAVYCFLFLLCLISLHITGRLTPGSGLAVMGSAALATAILLAFRLRPRWNAAFGAPTVRDITADHWGYGRWAAAAAPVAWIPEGIYFLILPAGFGLAEAGVLKALVNLAMPVLQSTSALGILLLQLLVRHRWNGGSGSMDRPMRRFLAVFLVGGGLYAGFLWVFRFQVLQLVYGGKYIQYASLPLLLTALLPLALCCAEPFQGGLRALQRPDLMFRSNALGAFFCLTCGWLMVTSLGVAGALAGMLLSRLIVAITSFLYYRTEESRQ